MGTPSLISSRLAVGNNPVTCLYLLVDGFGLPKDHTSLALSIFDLPFVTYLFFLFFFKKKKKRPVDTIQEVSNPERFAMFSTTQPRLYPVDMSERASLDLALDLSQYNMSLTTTDVQDLNKYITGSQSPEAEVSPEVLAEELWKGMASPVSEERMASPAWPESEHSPESDTSSVAEQSLESMEVAYGAAEEEDPNVGPRERRNSKSRPRTAEINQMERKRRHDLKSLYAGLRASMPKMAIRDGAAKCEIVMAAHDHIRMLEMRKSKLRSRRDQLRNNIRQSSHSPVHMTQQIPMHHQMYSMPSLHTIYPSS